MNQMNMFDAPPKPRPVTENRSWPAVASSATISDRPDPTPADLVKAVGRYLKAVLKDRKYCPRCMGYLPDKNHEPDCSLGMLMAAYEKVTNGTD